MSYPGTFAPLTPDKAAIIMAGTGEVITYAELDAASARFAQFMYDQGLRPDDSLAIFADNHRSYLEAFWAVTRSGMCFTTINRYLTAPEAAYIVNDCGAKVLLASPAVRDVAVEMLPMLQGAPIRLMFDETAEGFENYEATIAPYPAEPLEHQPRGSTLLYSSGTTGKPKGVKRQPTAGDITENDIIGELLLGGIFGFNADSVYLSPAPMYHSAPLAFTTGTQSLGGTVVMMDRFDPQDALRYIENYSITHSQWVPTMFSRMLKLDDAQRTAHDLSSHQVAVHAAAPCPVGVKQAMISWWGPILHEYYAGTELNGFCYVNSDDWLAHPGTVGKPLIGVIRICDDDGNEVPTGEVGTIYFEREEQPFEYHNDPEKTADSRHPDHSLWSTLGDMGRVDEEGFLYLTDRQSFMIISGGVNIYPQEIEDSLVLHPSVGDVAVFGIPNEEFGEEVKAVVQPISGVEGTDELGRELIEYCREHLAHYKVPRSIDFMDELPRLETGKLYKRLLRDAYWGDRTSRIV